MDRAVKDRALELVASRDAAVDGRNLLREYVQSRVLGALQEAGVFRSWAFMGGTALRFLYRIPRFSEDLDFTLERRAADRPFGDTVRDVARALEREGYSLRARVNKDAVVAKAMIGFVGLPYDAGLTPHLDEVLWVKLELDTQPPDGAVLEVSLVNRFGMLRLQHHDLPSLFAGKVAAVIAREYTKGRDLYDLMWYLTREGALQPNPTLLRNALLQTAPQQVTDAVIDWRLALKTRLGRVDWADARRDVAQFLEQPRDLALIDAGVLASLL
jgi:hypothetical protein